MPAPQYRPARAVHVPLHADDVSPVATPYLPTGQGEQAATLGAEEKVPGGHLTPVGEALPSPQNDPGVEEQAPVQVDTVRLAAAPYRPAAQGRQVGGPLGARYCP